MGKIELFVPGRVGLIGELSDLVSPYLSKNNKLIPGKCLACQLDKGIYSIAKKSDKIIYHFKDLEFACELNEEILLKEIRNNNFYSYFCGTILYMYRKYSIGGIEITITKMDLPIKNGLSSSASFCLTIVKAYNELYHLNLMDDEIIKCAHEGEILAGSRCGNLDYNSIMNDGLCLLTFYEDKTDIERINLKKNIYFLIVNLNSSKNTKLIMEVFNETLNDVDTKNNKILDIVGKKNDFLVKMAKEYLEKGQIKEFGNCLNEAQELMDKASDICTEFIAPKLHMIMQDEIVREKSFGIKSIGSGGDGSALIVCKSQMDKEDLNKYLNKKYQMESIEFTL